MTGKLLIQYMKKARYKTVGKARYDSFFPKQKNEKKKKKDVHSTRTGSRYTKMLLVIISVQYKQGGWFYPPFHLSAFATINVTFII